MPLSPAARVLALFRTKGLRPAHPQMNNFQLGGLFFVAFLNCAFRSVLDTAHFGF